MPLTGPWRSVGRTIVAVIGAAATITPMVVWSVTTHETGWLIEAACQLLVVAAILARILHWHRVSSWLDRIGLGREDPPTDALANPASPSITPTKGSTMARNRDVPAETPDQSLPDIGPDTGFNPDAPDQGFNPDHPDQGFNPDSPGQGLPGGPDQSLPDNPPAPGQPLPPTSPGTPDQGLPPGSPGAPDQGLPPGSPGLPDHGFNPDHPDNTLPPGVDVEPPAGPDGRPDNSLPPIVGGPSHPKGRFVFIPADLTEKYTVHISLESK